MNLSDISQYCKKHFPNIYEFLFARINTAIDMEERARIYVGCCTLLFFSAGLSYDSISYLFTGAYFLLAVNMVTLSVFVVLTVLFYWEKLGIYATLATLLFTVQVNASVSITCNYAVMSAGGDIIIHHDLFISFLVCVLASLTLKKNHVHILCVMPMASFATSLVLYSPVSLLLYFPSLLLAYTSPPVCLAYMRIFLWDTLREKERLLREKQSLCRLMGMNEQQWDMLIDVLQAPRVPREQTEQLFETIQEAVSNRLIIRAKRLLVSEDLFGKINEKKGFCLTPKEIQLCVLILEDKSILEISRALYINESTVRGNRSRVRKKLGLTKSANLKAYLKQLVAEVKNGS